jgi:hypothetical protein
LLLASFTNAMAQAPSVSSISVRPDGNTVQTDTTPVQNQDGSTGTSTTTTINDSNGQSATIDAHGHITNYRLKENCQASPPAPQIALTYVCYPVNGVLYKFDVEYLLYDCHPPGSDVRTMQRRFAVRFKNLGVPCNPDLYAIDVTGGVVYGETWPPATGGGEIKTDLSGSTATATEGGTSTAPGGSTTTGTNGGTTTGTGGGTTTGTNGGTTTGTGGSNTTGTGGGAASTGGNTSSSGTTTGRRPRKQTTKKTGSTVSRTQSQSPSSSSNASVPIGIGIGIGLGLGMGLHGGGDHGDFHGGDRR